MTRPRICPKCSCQNVISVYDRALDCTVGFTCELCGHEWKRDLGEVVSVADGAEFKEPERNGGRS